MGSLLEKEKYYQLRDILLGLRKGYLEQAKLLTEAKSYLRYDREQIQDILFSLYGDSTSDFQIQFLLQPQPLDKAKEVLSNCLGRSIDSFRTVSYNPSEVSIDVLQAEDKRCVASIVARSFSETLKKYSHAPFIEEVDYTISGKGTLSVLEHELSYDSDLLSFSYFPMNDRFYVDSKEQSILQGMGDALELSFDSSLFPSYHQTLISNGENKRFGFHPELAEYTRSFVFLEETPTQYILKRQR